MPQEHGAQPRGARQQHAPAHGPRLTTAGFLALLIGVSVLAGLVDLVVGLGIRLSLTLLFLPAFVSGFGTAKQTVLAGLWGLAGLAGSFYFVPTTTKTAATLLGVAFVLSALSVEAARRRLRQEQRLDRLRTTAGALQRQLLHTLPTREPEVAVRGIYQPVEEERLVGGDVYDVASGPDGRTRILIADVQGKGLPAIGAGFAVLGAFRESAARDEDLQRVAAALEDAVVRHNEQAERNDEPERFVTALLLETGLLETGLPESGRGHAVRAVNCGHVAPLLARTGKAAAAAVATGTPTLVEPLPEAPSVPLGLQALAPGPRTAHSFALPPASVLLLFTDGVTEARDPGGAFYPLESRLSAWSADGLPTGELLDRLQADVEEFTRGRQRDDVTVLTVEGRAEPVRSAAREGVGTPERATPRPVHRPAPTRRRPAPATASAQVSARAPIR